MFRSHCTMTGADRCRLPDKSVGNEKNRKNVPGQARQSTGGSRDNHRCLLPMWKSLGNPTQWVRPRIDSCASSLDAAVVAAAVAAFGRRPTFHLFIFKIHKTRKYITWKLYSWDTTLEVSDCERDRVSNVWRVVSGASENERTRTVRIKKIEIIYLFIFWGSDQL